MLFSFVLDSVTWKTFLQHIDLLLYKAVSFEAFQSIFFSYLVLSSFILFGFIFIVRKPLVLINLSFSVFFFFFFFFF